MENNLLTHKLSAGKKMNKTLHEMCGLGVLDDILCSDLIENINDHIISCNPLFIEFKDFHLSLLNHLYNFYQGLVQEFQVLLKALTDKCLRNITAYLKLSKVLLSLIREM